MADRPPPGVGRKISVVLPAYNEEESIERQVRSVDSVLREFRFEDYEVIVVDDGSADRTGEILEGLREEVPKLRTLVHETNRGYAKALATGFGGAAMPLVFYTDADNQFDIREIKNFLAAIDDYEIVCGFRIYRFDPLSRLILSWGYNLLVRILFRIRVRDVDCAFKLFRREVFDTIHVESDKFFVDTEILAKASRQKMRMTEIGVRHFPREAGESTVRPSHVLSTLREIASMWVSIV
ncbi:MAG: glycosyltransferase family 2 protein, partial [Gemmatimonadota bacterium]|nr:glycosyltransferase family 2 protein [Gemmatimonadota bacterium]